MRKSKGWASGIEGLIEEGEAFRRLSAEPRLVPPECPEVDTPAADTSLKSDPPDSKVRDGSRYSRSRR
jgi:hypothetical protein